MYSLVGVIGFLTSIIATPVFRNLGNKLRFYDVPDDDALKIHKQPISSLGGAAILLAVLASAVVAVVFTEVNLGRLLGVLSCGLLVFGLGLWDDLKWKNTGSYKPAVKFTFQVSISLLAGLGLFAFGVQIRFIPISIVAVLLGSFYVFGGINAVNMQDGIDGLAGGLVAISAAGFIVLSAYTGNALGFVLSLALLGAVLGFLIYNFHPASVFMGDNGSHFLGFMVALLALTFTSKPYGIRWLIGPILIIGLPIFDAACAVIRRLIRRKPLFEGDRGHLYDRLMHKGLSMRQTVLICYLIQAVFVAGGVALVL